MKIACCSVFALVALGVAMPAGAAETYFTGQLDVRAGYGSNPYLGSSLSGGTGQFGATLVGALNHKTTYGTTTLSGTADVTQNSSRYGRNQNYIASLRRDQTFSDHLSGHVGARYSSTLNPGQLVDYTSARLDLLTIGQRTENYGGDLGFAWEATGRDSFTGSGDYSHLSFRGFNTDYNQYNAALSYLHKFDARTTAGVGISGARVDSSSFPSSSSMSINALLTRQIGTKWSFSGGAGVILPDNNGGYSNNPTISFSAQFCGKYTHANICLTSARQSAPSGIGGLRNNLQFGARLSYELDTLQTVSVQADYTRTSGGSQYVLPRQTFYQASTSYSRLITRRVSLGGSARVQRRDFGAFGRGTSYGVTIDIITRLGRI